LPISHKNCQRTNILSWRKKAGSSLGGAVNAQFSEDDQKQIYVLDNEKTSDFRKWLQDAFKS
jgi:hypothetical protein